MMPIQRYGYDLTCDVCGETGPAVEIAEPHEEEEPHNSVQVCRNCLINMLEEWDGLSHIEQEAKG